MYLPMYVIRNMEGDKVKLTTYVGYKCGTEINVEARVFLNVEGRKFLGKE